jgi:hypothetical protein
MKIRKIKSRIPIILLGILLIAGTASAATVTPVGTCNGQNKVDVALNVNDVTGIIAYDVTVTGTDLTTSIGDVSKDGSIAASWLVYSVSAVTDGVRIIAATSSGGGTTGAGSLGKITFTAPDGVVNAETVAVIVNSASIVITPADYTPVDCSEPVGCSVWDDVLAEYNEYLGDTKTWAEVITCYTAYVGTR